VKRKDLMIVGVIAFIAALFSLFVSNAIFGSPSRNPIKVPVVHEINPEFPVVKDDTNYTSFFNDKALNPTQLIEIGNGTNTKPFEDTH
jgi:hypothetical protein